MNTEARKVFIEWHDEKIEQGEILNFRHEFEQYCRSDVDILCRATMKFRKLIMENTKGPNDEGIDPFRFVTIASACMGIYKSKFMTEKWQVLTNAEKQKASLEGRQPNWLNATLCGDEMLVKRDGKWVFASVIAEKRFINSPLAVVPLQGYRRDVYSQKSICYMEWLE
jgi:hypothetical protein